MAKTSGGMAVAITAATVATLAGAYWLYGSQDSPKHRKMAKGWMLKARGEIVDAVGKIQEIDKSKYFELVDKTVKTYAAQAGATSSEVVGAIRDMKASWDHIQKTHNAKSKVGAKKARTGLKK